MKQQLQTAIKIFGILAILTGLIYPLMMTLVAQISLPQQANGSLVLKGHQVIGSALIAQNTTGEKYFWPRPSAIDYDPMKPSGGSNLGPTSQKLKDVVKQRQNRYGQDAPAELLYASGSGLDPHISVQTALFQVERVAKARAISPDDLKHLIHTLSEGHSLGKFDTGYINVLLLNQVLDQRK